MNLLKSINIFPHALDQIVPKLFHAKAPQISLASVQGPLCKPVEFEGLTSAANS